MSHLEEKLDQFMKDVIIYRVKALNGNLAYWIELQYQQFKDTNKELFK